MKKAVIAIQGKQHVVTEGQELVVDRLSEGKSISTEALMVIDGEKTDIGTPTTSTKVTLEVVNPEVKGEKVMAIRYKAKKRVHKVRGHRQPQTKVVVKKIA